MEKDNFKNFICRVLVAVVALCVICSTINRGLLPVFAAGAVLTALRVIFINLTA